MSLLTGTTRRSAGEAGSQAALRPGDTFVDPQALMSIRNLELRARTVVEGFWTGLHRSPYHGFSVEFTEYRPYSPGDDPRYLDWRLYARTDRSYLKKFEDETNTRCYLLVDLSRSMNFGSRGYAKLDYARTLAATLAWFLSRQGDAVGLMTFDAQVRDFVPARHRSGHLRNLMLRLDQPAQGRSTRLDSPLERFLALVRKRSVVILISDLLAPLDNLERPLTAVSASGHEVIAFHVFDPAEEGFSFEKSALFHDLETEQELYVDPDSARTHYLGNLKRHCDQLLAICQKLGIALRRLPTDQPLELALLDFLKERMRRGKLSRRATTP